MKATEILKQEHVIILQVLDCLATFVEKSETTQKLDSLTAGNFISFFKNYADQFHHGKEEDHLFKVMKLKKGFSGGCSPVAVMVREHELGRLYVGGMASHSEAAAAGDSEELQWFIENARSYIKLLREHIKKEDFCLFPAADRSLTDEDQRQLSSAFEKVDGQGIGERQLPIANQLVAQFGV